ncbi:MAG TPA: DUF1592 domain-containing protein [Pirellulaceae bacterium]|nr:DUF1592 domain-containing protein [Pirellulaceae bacterium]
MQTTIGNINPQLMLVNLLLLLIIIVTLIYQNIGYLEPSMATQPKADAALPTSNAFTHNVNPALMLQDESTAESSQDAYSPLISERPESSGKAIYEAHCAQCHGERGQGTSKYRDSFHEDLAFDELQSYIDATMPEDDPAAVTGDDARLVAEYIFEELYSPESRQQLTVARLAFSRLTVRQFQESLADLFAAFADPPWHSEERGLKAHYFAARNWTQDRKLAEQIDAALDFGDGVPHFDPRGLYTSLPAKEKPDENKMNEGFSVYWRGSLLAPRTGIYTITVESKNGFQLRLNGDQPLIDRKVRSDEVVEHVAQIFLLGGRAYPLSIDFFSYPDPPARFRLLWKPPMGVTEVIPQRNLMPHSVPESLAVASQFPADDASHGYARGISISQEWNESVTSAAIEAATWASDRVWRLAKTEFKDEHHLEKVKSFCRRFVELAFARPITDEEGRFFVDQHFENELSIPDQVARVVLLTVTSPRFLYPALEERTAAYNVAKQLALTVWDSVPDKQLMEQAAQGKLSEIETLRSEIGRMMQDPRARAKINEFFKDWLRLDRASQASKDHELFAGFDERLLHELRLSLETYLSAVFWSNDSNFRELILADYLFATRRLAEFYNLTWADANQDSGVDGFVKLSATSQKRAGIVTHPFMMAGLAYHRTSSPIHRGVFVARNLLGVRLKQPNENFEPLAEDFDPNMTTRQRVEFQTKDAACMGCHVVINPLGFSLEEFDAVGRYRTTERDKPIDAAAMYEAGDGSSVSFQSGRDLAEYVAASEDAQKTFVRQLFQLYVRQPIDAYGQDQLELLYHTFVKNGYNMRELLTDIALLSATRSSE